MKRWILQLMPLLLLVPAPAAMAQEQNDSAQMVQTAQTAQTSQEEQTLQTALAAQGIQVGEPAVTASYERSSRTAVISGSLGTREGSVVTIQVRSPLNQLDYENQAVTGPGGSFAFRYTPAEQTNGTYRVRVGGEGLNGVLQTTFIIGRPSAELGVELSPALPDGQQGWYVQPVTLTLHTSETRVEIEYRIKGRQDWKTYRAPLTFDQDGEYEVEYRSGDSPGQSGGVQSAVFKLDQTAPVTTAQVESVGSSSDTGTALRRITLQAKDNVSVGETVFRMDGGEWAAYSQPVTAEVYGTTMFEYRSTDTAGNVEAVKSVTLTSGQHTAQLGVTVNPSVLQPARGRMMTVTASVYAEGSIRPGSVVLESITANEQLRKGDVENASFGSYDRSFRLRAITSSPGADRIYLIKYSARDRSGQKIYGTAEVRVPAVGRTSGEDMLQGQTDLEQEPASELPDAGQEDALDGNAGLVPGEFEGESGLTPDEIDGSETMESSEES